MVFFFSSRRRHTRCLSDWSSDVCSSDLFTSGTTGVPKGATLTHRNLLVTVGSMVRLLNLDDTDVFVGSLPFSHVRSEERRVGKESRSRRAQNQYQITEVDRRMNKQSTSQ